MMSAPVVKYCYLSGSSSVHFLSIEEERKSWNMGARRSFLCPNIQKPSEGIDATPERRRVIGFLGRLDVNHKGLDILLNSIDLCQQTLRRRSYTVEIVGPDYRGGYSWLRQKIQRLGLQDVVQMLPAKSGDEKVSWLRGVSIFVHPSRYEGQPQAVFEALLEGVYPVVSDRCNMTEEIAALGFGAVASAEPHDFACALVNAIKEGRELSASKRASVAGRYAPQTVATIFAEQLRKCL